MVVGRYIGFIVLWCGWSREGAARTIHWFLLLSLTNVHRFHNGWMLVKLKSVEMEVGEVWSGSETCSRHLSALSYYFTTSSYQYQRDGYVQC